MSKAEHIDKALVRRILDGDEQAFRDTFNNYFPRLYRYAKTRLNGNHDDACEVVQQTFCKAIEHLDSYRGEAALYSWFCQICKNTLIDFYRTNRVVAQKTLLFEDHPSIQAVLESLAAPISYEPESDAWRRDVVRLVQATIDALPVKYGDVLEWKYVDDLSVREIAANLAVSEKAAESMLTRARVAFRDAFVEMIDVSEVLSPDATSGSGLPARD